MKLTEAQLTEAQRTALALFGERRWMFEQDVCTAYIGKQLAALGYVERSSTRARSIGGGRAVSLHITDAGLAALTEYKAESAAQGSLNRIARIRRGES